MMLEIIAKIGLFFCYPPVLASIIIIGFLTMSEKIYGHALFLMLFTMIYNFYLKFLFQLPLPPPMEGWAFPSGHMHVAVVFWGWLAVAYRQVAFSAVVFLILNLVGYGLIYHGYHYPQDILGSLGFGSLTLIVYSGINRLSIFKQKPYTMGILLISLGAILMWLLPPEMRKLHLWQALGALIGFTIGWGLLQSKRPLIFSSWQKIVLLLVAIIPAALLIAGMKFLLPISSLVIFTTFFLIAMWVSCSKLIGSKLMVN